MLSTRCSFLFSFILFFYLFSFLPLLSSLPFSLGIYFSFVLSPFLFASFLYSFLSSIPFFPLFPPFPFLSFHPLFVPLFFSLVTPSLSAPAHLSKPVFGDFADDNSAMESLFSRHFRSRAFEVTSGGCKTQSCGERRRRPPRIRRGKVQWMKRTRKKLCPSVSVSVRQCPSVSVSVRQCPSVSVSVCQCLSVSVSVCQCL